MDLFSGAGGLSLGFSQTGRFSIVAAAENNSNARKTYLRNHKNTRLYSDVRTIDYQELLESLGDIDVVIGGPPCQGFSNANRQHTTIVSMNNHLVKEYVRAICELKPKAFVMENVAMLRSHLHRFIVDENDLLDQRVMDLDMQEDKIELLPESASFPEALEFAKQLQNVISYAWTEEFYKIINLLYRNRINPPKFAKAVGKYKKTLISKLSVLKGGTEEENPSLVQLWDATMATSILKYIENDGTDNFAGLIRDIEKALMLQRMLSRMQEINENNIHVFRYELDRGSVVAVVKSYAVLDYIKGILENAPYNYRLEPKVLNAIDYGAPQRRERFIIVGISAEMAGEYILPKAEFTDNYRTVYDAISDLQDIPVSTEVAAKPIVLGECPALTELGRQLRGKILYNHVCTATKETAQKRFEALKEGQNFHDLDPSLKTTYSNADRTQNTIYMRLRYNEPSGTVVNVRKSMWIHPELDRAISIREAARLQTFPDTFVFEGTKDSQYQQVGNAVPPILAKAIAKSLLPILDSNCKDEN
nr:DNA cytosine methyltransferase [Oscillibacter sp. ER4]